MFMTSYSVHIFVTVVKTLMQFVNMWFKSAFIYITRMTQWLYLPCRWNQYTKKLFNGRGTFDGNLHYWSPPHLSSRSNHPMQTNVTMTSSKHWNPCEVSVFTYFSNVIPYWTFCVPLWFRIRLRISSIYIYFHNESYQTIFFLKTKFIFLYNY
jgi:hypothetical protein